MARVATHVVVAVPSELCQEAVQSGLSDERVRDAARRLRPGKEYSGYVTSLRPGRWLEITFAALDPLTGKRSHTLGWRVTYDFLPLDDGRTRVEVAIEYGLAAALGAAGLLRAQAENDIAHRVMALHALEYGFARRPAAALGGARPDHEGHADRSTRDAESATAVRAPGAERPRAERPRAATP